MIGTRAVEKPLTAGKEEYCGYLACEYAKRKIASSSRAPIKEVIANVYENGKWSFVVHFHVDCYNKLGQPYGPILNSKKRKEK